MASSNQAANSRKGSSASVKSPLVNHLGVQSGPCRTSSRSTSRGRCRDPSSLGGSVIVERARPRLWRRLRQVARACAVRLALRRLQPVLAARFVLRQGQRQVGQHRLGHAVRRRSRGSDDCRPTPISPMRARRSTEVLSRGEKDASLPWENPATGARGTVTPIASPTPRTARPAAISWRAMSAAAAQSWLQGEACRSSRAIGRCARSSPGSARKPARLRRQRVASGAHSQPHIDGLRVAGDSPATGDFTGVRRDARPL